MASTEADVGCQRPRKWHFQRMVSLALSNSTTIFGHIPPHTQKGLPRLMSRKATLTEDTLRTALYGRPPEIGMVMKASGARCQMGKWLPGLPSQSAIL